MLGQPVDANLRLETALQILLTNDDGIYAPGLAALEAKLPKLGDVSLVAPATEQSGVGHSITFLEPLVCKKVFDGMRFRGYAVEGSPADCVKLGVSELVEEKVDLIVSGINGGLNAGYQRAVFGHRRSRNRRRVLPAQQFRSIA